MKKAEKRKTVRINKRKGNFLRQELHPIDFLPMRPPGYFTNCYTQAEIQEQNLLAKASVICAPPDLE